MILLYDFCLWLQLYIPLAVTVDHQALQDSTVTVRMRESMSQERIKISELDSYLAKETAYP
ncbi:MAG: His/Gly/Thr/Pro-type tRNA ligase C-terminal domain-containing protein [Nitrososphaerales archaeon]